jgi:BsuBI/PstI restriction endonuclease domain/BsuBI/PstI restriction endonuclease HTH domain
VKYPNIEAALEILTVLGFPKAQLNSRSALTLLALANVRSQMKFADASAPLMGITPIMDWARDCYGATYAPNSRETFRRQTMHQFLDAGLVLYNPDKPTRPVNSPAAVYQLSPEALTLVQSYGYEDWGEILRGYLQEKGSLAERYASERQMQRVPVKVSEGLSLQLSPGAHSELIRDIIEDFAERFAPGSILIYAGDTGDKWGYFDAERLLQLGVSVDNHGKMPDVVLHFVERDWLLLVESVTSHGPVDAKRHTELMTLFEASSAGLVYVTAFPTRAVMSKYLADIAWETEVWVADSPSHLIHFNGVRFLGPYK